MKNCIPFLVLLFLVFSCKKDKEIINDLEPNPSSTTASDYFQLKIGNYWVYETTQFNNKSIDSSIVSRDTVIRNQTYFVIEGHDLVGSWNILNIFRDSSNYIVDQNGFIFFALNNFEDTLARIYIPTGTSDTLVSIHYKMISFPTTITVPAGAFDSLLNYRGEIFNHSNQNIQYTNYYYRKNIGLIESNVPFFASPDRIEKKLLRYKIN